MFNKDFGKLVSDLLKEDSFPDTAAFEYETTNRDLKVNVKASAEREGSIATVVTSIWKFNTGKELKTEFKKNGDIANTITAKFDSVKGLTVIGGISLGAKSQSANIGVDYLFAKGTSSVKFNFPTLNNVAAPDIDLGFVFQANPNIALGVAANVKPDHETQKLSNITLNGQYSSEQGTVNLAVGAVPSGGSSVSFGLFRSFNPTTAGALAVNYKQTDKKVQTTRIKGGVRRAYGSAYSRIVLDSDFNLRLGYETPLLNGPTLKIGTLIDLQNQHHTTGFTILYKA